MFSIDRAVRSRALFPIIGGALTASVIAAGFGASMPALALPGIVGMGVAMSAYGVAIRGVGERAMSVQRLTLQQAGAVVVTIMVAVLALVLVALAGPGSMVATAAISAVGLVSSSVGMAFQNAANVSDKYSS